MSSATSASFDQTRRVAEHVAALGPFDAVIHNAAVSGRALLPVNVVAPCVLAALVRAERLDLSSSMHRGGSADLSRADWSGARHTLSYSDSKLLVTTLMAAIARRWPSVLSNAVDPAGYQRGWAGPRPATT